MTDRQPERPNIAVILVDDLGFSDLGCFGSEIHTPNIDALAAQGLRFTQMYSAAKCCPSRAALLTGLNPHQAGIGHMTDNYDLPSYQGYLNDRCATIAELLQPAGYRTLMSGKWHVGADYEDADTSAWPVGDPEHPHPRQRGFDRFFGMLGGAGSFFNPPGLMTDDSFTPVETPGFYFTDAIADHAVRMMDESIEMGQPFLLYASFTAPHSPLHAPEEDIARYEGTYRGGWDALRTSRHEELLGMGLLNPKWRISPRPAYIPAWDDAPHRDWEDLRMAVYAAQIDRMDQAVGRITARLNHHGIADNTVVVLLSDNGGCAARLSSNPTKGKQKLYSSLPTPDGKKVRMGNDPSIRPGPADTHQSYDVWWANASNTPFRLFKNWAHEGGISSPCIVRWPDQVDAGGMSAEPAYINDITATCLEAAGVPYPAELDGRPLLPIEGESFLPLLQGRPWSRQKPITVEHEGNRCIRMANWKLVGETGGPWELYDMEEDRTELDDLMGSNAGKAEELRQEYEAWAQRCGVLPWPVDPQEQGSSRTLLKRWGTEME